MSAADFYATVPTAVIRFLETDSQTKLMAKPQLRGQEGEEITLNLGDDFPVPSTTFGSLGGAGSVATQPISSFNYRPVGIIVNVTPRVTFDGDIVLELTVESSTIGQDVNIAGQNLPSFGSRKVETKIRLRDGESTLLAGLLREDEHRALTGFPGLMHLPVFKQLFTSNDLSKGQTDIVMLLTPRIVRGHELSQQDVNPVYIGSQQHLGLSGPPPLIAPPATEPPSRSPRRPCRRKVEPSGSRRRCHASGTLPSPGIVPPSSPGAPPRTPQPAPPQSAVEPLPHRTVAGRRRGAALPTLPTPVTGAVQLVLTPPGTEFGWEAGPYTVPISVTNAPRMSTRHRDADLQSCASSKWAPCRKAASCARAASRRSSRQQVDPVAGRVDLTIVRDADVVGASGSGLVAARAVRSGRARQHEHGTAGFGHGARRRAITVKASPASGDSEVVGCGCEAAMWVLTVKRHEAMRPASRASRSWRCSS